ARRRGLGLRTGARRPPVARPGDGGRARRLLPPGAGPPAPGAGGARAVIGAAGGSAPAAGPERPVGLDTLLAVMPERELLGPLPATIRGLTDDSRRVTPGSCFVAVRGLHVDGRRFIPQAVERGARAVVVEPPDPCPGQAVGRILVPDTRRALPRLA